MQTKRYTTQNTYKYNSKEKDIIPKLSPLASKRQRKRFRKLKRGQSLSL